jgi:hypothetical protein
VENRLTLKALVRPSRALGVPLSVLFALAGEYSPLL